MRFEKYKIGDISTVSAGGDRPSICSEIKTRDTSVPIFSNGMENEGLYGYTNQAKVEGDTVTVSARGVNVGTVCYRTESFLPIVRLLSLVPNRKIVDSKYLYYYLKNIQISGTGSAQPQVTIPMISNLEILIHKDLTEQKLIADYLYLLDKKIKINIELNRNLLEQAKSLYQSWFVNLEPFEGVRPENWIDGTVEDLAKEIVCGKTPTTKKEEYYGEYMPFVTIPDMHGCIYAVTTTRSLSDLGVKSQKKKTIPKNSICISCIGTAGLVVLLPKDCQTNQQINSIIPKNDCLKSWQTKV